MIRIPALLRLALLAIAMLTLAAPPAGTAKAQPMLQYDVVEGRNLNSFLREGKVAAHLLLRSGNDPRIIVAFPAGNSGVGLWFARTGGEVRWSLDAPPRPVTLADARGRPLHGMVAEVTARTPTLVPDRAILSSVRVLRDYQTLHAAPAQVLTDPVIAGRAITWARDRLDGAPGYRLSIDVLEGSLRQGAIVAGPGGRLKLRITAASGETPLGPLERDALLSAAANPDPGARKALTFLSYHEKYLAGSWRFNTYFGRDTLMSMRLLMPALEPGAVEAGLRAVLARLAPNGEVAHEEDIGEFAVLRHRKENGTLSDAPIYDYAMIDDDFMLAPVAAAWLLDDARGRARAAGFLGQDSGAAGKALARNLDWVVERTAAFAAAPVVANLVGLKEGRKTGQWRDSEEGLGRGRYVYDVNAVFVPAALDAADRLVKSGLLDNYLAAARGERLAQAGKMAAIWRAEAPPLFDLAIPAVQARKAVSAYARSIDVPPDAALRSLGEEPVRFHALSLDAEGKPVPILHSDEGFALLFANPSPEAVTRAVSAMMRPFPAGLFTDIGMLVANPVFAAPDAQARFGNSAYHGTVVWSWQQAVLAAGLERQLRRTDLPPPVRTRLAAAQMRLWNAISAASAVRNSELWSWRYANGQFNVAPFGARGADEDESNAAQLWSTVFLALGPPTRRSDPTQAP